MNPPTIGRRQVRRINVVRNAFIAAGSIVAAMTSTFLLALQRMVPLAWMGIMVAATFFLVVAWLTRILYYARRPANWESLQVRKAERAKSRAAARDERADRRADRAAQRDDHVARAAPVYAPAQQPADADDEQRRRDWLDEIILDVPDDDAAEQRGTKG